MLLLLTCLAGKQTAIKIGKGAVKGMTLSAEHVSEWIDTQSIDYNCMDYVYSNASDQFKQEKHKEELKQQRHILNAQYCSLIDAAVEKYHYQPSPSVSSHHWPNST